MTKDILDGWLIKNQNMTMVYEGVRELLVALKGHNKQISVVSDWFKECQYKRLEKAGLLSYIDTFVFGDTALKPNKEAYEKAYNKELKEVPTHGGLETGYISRLFPDMDIVTMGPNCIDIHTPQERLEIKTLYEVHDFLKNWLGEL